MSTRIGPLTRVAVFVGTTLISCTISPPITAAQGGTDGRQREREFLEHRTFQGTAIERDAYDRALEEWRRLEKATPASAPRPAPGPSGPTSTLSPLSLSSSSAVTGLTGTVWTPMGPSPIQQGTSHVNGRVSAIAVHPYNPNVIYLG